MDTASYQAVKLKLEHEKVQIEIEITNLQQKKEKSLQQKEKEYKKLYATQEIFKQTKTVTASRLRVDFNVNVVKQADKEINLLEKYIQTQNIELEKINEKQKYVDQLYMVEQQKVARKRQSKEESLLHEYKRWLK